MIILLTIYLVLYCIIFIKTCKCLWWIQSFPRSGFWLILSRIWLLRSYLLFIKKKIYILLLFIWFNIVLFCIKTCRWQSWIQSSLRSSFWWILSRICLLRTWRKYMAITRLQTRPSFSWMISELPVLSRLCQRGFVWVNSLEILLTH